MLLDTVRTHTAATLGHAGSGAITDRQAFQDLGFDSLAAVDLRNRIAATIGLRLPATLVFDYPTPAVLAQFLRDELGVGEESPSVAVLAELDRLEASLGDIDLEQEDVAPVVARLRKLAAKLHGPAEESAADLDLATDDEILRLAEAELDRP